MSPCALSGGIGEPVFQTLLVSVCGSLLAIVMVGAFFLIYNSFQISLSKRMQQFGLLASVGATREAAAKLGPL